MLCEIVLVLIVIKVFCILTTARCKSHVCLVGKTALICGGNSGLGLAAAYDLACRGCKVIIADNCDSTETVKKITKDTYNHNVTSYHVDLASFKSIRDFSNKIDKEVEKLDILFSNAGISDLSSRKTEDGLQKIMQVNYFGHFLLIHLLSGLLLRSAPSRVVMTSSVMAYLCNTHPDDFSGEPPENRRKFISAGAYGISKMYIVASVVALSEKFRNTGVTVNCFHPGFVKTSIWHTPTLQLSLTWDTKIIGLLTCLLGKNAEEGIQTMIHLACSDSVKDVSGGFFMELFALPKPSKANDEDFRKKLWAASEKFVGLQPHEKLDVIVENYKRNKK